VIKNLPDSGFMFITIFTLQKPNCLFKKIIRKILAWVVKT
jgi:hypothetical protein